MTQPTTSLQIPPLTSASLYVGDLAPEVTESQLFELFSAVGAVASIRVCRDAVTRHSLGYAYVNFHSVVDAERALDTMNFTLIQGRQCRIMWSQRDPSLRKSGIGNIFVKNLDKSIDSKTLYDTFSMFGNILSCKVAMQRDKPISLGYGFVHYETDEAARKAIQNVNGMSIAGQKVLVASYLPKTERATTIKNFTNVYVKNLPDTINAEEKLIQYFKPFGTITKCMLALDTEHKAKGFAFINYENHEDANKAIQEMNDKEIDGKKLYVNRHQSRIERDRELKEKFEKMKIEQSKKFAGVNLYIKNLADDFDDEKLRVEFDKFGTITSAKVMRDNTNHCKGFGFVCYSTPEEATKAVSEMNGKMVAGKPLYVALAQTKEARRVQREMVQRAKTMPPSMYQGPTVPGAPMFYRPPMPNQPAVVYPQLMPGQRWNLPPPQMLPPNVRGPAPYINPQMPPPQVASARGRGIPGRGMPSNMPQPTPNQPSVGRVMPQPVPQPFQYRPNVRNPNMPPPMMAAPYQVPLTAELLANAPPQQQKQIIGERLFPLIQASQPERAGKITGMLLEMDNGELLHLLESREALVEKIQEAVTVLNEHEQFQSTTQPAQPRP